MHYSAIYRIYIVLKWQNIHCSEILLDNFTTVVAPTAFSVVHINDKKIQTEFQVIC